MTNLRLAGDLTRLTSDLIECASEHDEQPRSGDVEKTAASPETYGWCGIALDPRFRAAAAEVFSCHIPAKQEAPADQTLERPTGCAIAAGYAHWGQ